MNATRVVAVALGLGGALLVVRAVFGFAPAGPATWVEDPLIEPHNSSLTTYLSSSSTAIAGVRPRVQQRAVGLDGALRDSPGLPLTIGANPFGAEWSRTRHNDVRLATGNYSPMEVDLALPAPGFSWVVSRQLNHRQLDGSTHKDSNGPQGKNWSQGSQPELLLYEAASDANDLLYLVLGADRFVEYKRVNGSSTDFRGVNGAVGVFDFTAAAGSNPDLYVIKDQRGFEYTFFGWSGFEEGDEVAAGQLWQIEDEDGNVAYVGSLTNGDTAIASGYDSAGRITKAYDSAGRRFTYTYTTLDGTARLTQVKAETKTGGTWEDTPTGVTERARVDYSYYSDESYGDVGGLKLVKVTTPLTDSGVESVRETYLRYWEGTYNASTNPGHPHALKLIVGAEGTRAYDWDQDSQFDDDFLTASNAALEPYADAYFEYDADHRIKKSWTNGECGCTGTANGVHEYEYEDSGYTNSGVYDEEWATRTIVKRPDGSYVTTYFDEVAQALTEVITDADPDNTSPAPSQWVTWVVRDADGLVSEIHTPANVTGYTHSSGAVTASSSVGLMHTFTRISSGGTKGFLSQRKWKEGTGGSAYLDLKLTYAETGITWGGPRVLRPYIATRRVYTALTTDPDTSYLEWTYTNVLYTSPDKLATKTITVAAPAVSTGNNGPNTSVSTAQYFDKDGRVMFDKSGRGKITYREYTNGQLTKLIEDADTESGDVTIPTAAKPEFESDDTTEHHRKTTYAYDAQGRRDTTTLPDGRVLKTYYSRLKDERPVTLAYSDYKTDPKFYGPVQYSVSNLAGQTEVQAVVELSGTYSTTALTGHVDETDADPITAMDLGTVAQMTVSLYTDSGTTLTQSRLYHVVPASGSGSDGTNYDATLFGYDDQGRQIRVKEATGTISRTAYDKRGQVTSRLIGTNDNGYQGGESSGTANMVTTEELVYDAGYDDGNGLLTKRTLYVEDGATGKRETTYSYDVRGNLLLETRPQAPHAFHKYDAMNRRVATGLFSSTASIVLGTDDPTSEATSRLALSQTFYDEVGRVWKTQGHKIDDADGSDDDNLQALSWHDADGNLLKTDGGQLTKTTYDGLGRATHRFVLASDDDTVYADADDVTGDIVLEESQTTYEADSGDVVMSAAISRFHDDYGGSPTTGALDTNADADKLQYTDTNVKGRIQITASWYDDFGRVTSQVAYGTNAGSTFDRDGLSAPSVSTDTVLLTTYTYNYDGTLSKITDPKALVTDFVYDDAGRKTKEVRNYDAGVNSGNPSGTADNQTVKYEYTDGLLTKLTADVVGDDDQDTVYVYGTTKGASAGDSKIATGHMLKEAKYPDTSGATDTVTYAYNAQSEIIWTEDQAQSVIETVLDTGGRATDRKVTTLASGFDGAVRRISTSYDGLSRAQLVTQYDAASSGNLVDEVKHTYDDWAGLEKFEQDRNSAVSGGGDQYVVSYGYEKATGGRNTVRRTSMTLPSGNVINYSYSTTSHDDKVSRVSQVSDGTAARAQYWYNGLGHVVLTLYAEPNLEWDLSGSVGVYPDLDRFDRVTSSRWTKNLSTDKDFYDCDISYDRNSNITLVDDHVHSGYDASYTNDDLDRLADADEGTWSGGSITSRKRRQIWTLDHLGNWDIGKLDLNGDGDYVDTNEYNDDRTHNKVNELTARDTDDNGTDNYTLTYDAVGNLTDDGENYEYVYDAFGRLRKVNDRSDDSLVAEYKYNGLGFRISVHEDTDTDGDVDSNDKWYHFAYDERWRMVSVYRESDSAPKEEFLNHQAGLDGFGGSSYIDLVICRDKDKNTAWTAASDGVLEDRNYYCQNWRADVVAVVDKAALMGEWAKYTSYGIPIGMPGGDTDSDGDCDSTDISNVDALISSGYDVRADVDLDGDVDSLDKAILQVYYQGTTLGWEKLSWLGSRKGYAGYELDGVIGNVLYHVRARTLKGGLGRWSRRDEMGYASAQSLLVYGPRSPMVVLDPDGMLTRQLKSMWEGSCGAFGVDWLFMLSAPAGTLCGGKGGNIIQEVTVEWIYPGCASSGDPKNEKKKNDGIEPTSGGGGGGGSGGGQANSKAGTYSFYEAFYVDADSSIADDHWINPSKPGVGDVGVDTFATKTITGKARFFCLGDIDFSSWVKPFCIIKGGKYVCYNAPPFLKSFTGENPWSCTGSGCLGGPPPRGWFSPTEVENGRGRVTDYWACCDEPQDVAAEVEP